MVPEGWEASTLGQCVAIRSGGTPSKQKPEFWGGEVPWVSAKDLKTHLISDAQDHLTAVGAEHAKMAEADSVLILVRGMTLLKDVPIGFVTKPVAFNQDLKALVANDDIDPKFLSYLLVAKKLQMMGLVNTANHGTGRLDTDLLKGLPVDVPPLPEQRKIADILSTWDAAIEKTEALLATAKAQKRAFMQSLLTGKRRFPEFEGQPWKEVRIGEVAREISERNKNDTALTVISCTKTIGFVNSLDYFKKKVFSDDLSGYKIIRRNQIGYPSNHVEEGSIGIQNLHDAALVSPIYTIFETGAEVDPMYLFRVLKTDRYRQIFAAATSASVDRRGSLRWKAFATIKVRLPSLHEQRWINEALSVADNEISDLESSAEKLRTEKKALMQQLLTGKRRMAV